MDDLARWLGAQLDEDERIARAATGEDWGVVDPSQPYVIFDVAAFRANRTLEYVGRLAAVERDEDRAFIAAHDPARVLREIEAKRAIVARYERAMENRRAHPKDLASAGALLALHGVVGLLALPYADREGYREEWRP